MYIRNRNTKKHKNQKQLKANLKTKTIDREEHGESENNLKLENIFYLEDIEEVEAAESKEDSDREKSEINEKHKVSLHIPKGKAFVIPVEVKGYSKKHVNALIDSGAQSHFISKKLAEEIGLDKDSVEVEPIEIQVALKGRGTKTNRAVQIPLEVKLENERNIVTNISTYIVEGLKDQIYLGLPFVKKYAKYLPWESVEVNQIGDAIEHQELDYQKTERIKGTKEKDKEKAGTDFSQLLGLFELDTEPPNTVRRDEEKTITRNTKDYQKLEKVGYAVRNKDEDSKGLGGIMKSRELMDSEQLKQEDNTELNQIKL
ncbi:hypothetical protein BN7_6760 [Wickerhamomyces ciferrii]|uniref:Uncharacterized protein n=1 Tax=Wickerhamomyces ciferrii (strain ATCC 14091 / BCRC 22168 / CBS 111 / JCM 3599 / NBRC 0793 / NRRL Y-1031 F-60-10) TaxID=1206466 RepID=K0KV83_WICCF|nr:uncharacterized protein BN7_6760 [Wickerhamomyces ciferrii]CCH47146.1 hypothetical protein BN7_6760 [Wickerhamomyces ciferrii]